MYYTTISKIKITWLNISFVSKSRAGNKYRYLNLIKRRFFANFDFFDFYCACQAIKVYALKRAAFSRTHLLCQFHFKAYLSTANKLKTKELFLN